MKKIVYMLIVGLMITITSCNEDFLNVGPLDQFGDNLVWQDPAMVEVFINDIYQEMPHGFEWCMLASASDESMVVWSGLTEAINNSQQTSSNLQLWEAWTGKLYKQRTWVRVYPQIQKCNVFFHNINNGTTIPASELNRLKGEVYFLRAYYYFTLVNMYGGVPIIHKTYGLKDKKEDFEVPRNTLEESFKAIVADLDSAQYYLPLNNETGRAAKGAAMALKSRVLLYAASDIFADPSWAGDYAHPELISFPSNSKKSDRWTAAKSAAKATMELGIYSLYKGDPAAGDSIAKNYAEMFILKQTSEDILVKHFLDKMVVNFDEYDPGKYNYPNGWHGWGGNCPTGQFVDDFEMRDGSKFDWNNPAHAAKPYVNRDPRFYANVLYEGAKFCPRPADVQQADPFGIVQVGYYETWDSTKNKIKLVPGLDTRKGIDDWNGSHTGYYLRKFMDEANYWSVKTQECPWRYIRYAEVLLNYAEACNELGDDGEAQRVINLIRKRAGMPATTKAGAELKALIRNERRIELAYEDHRYFDVRRWMIAESAYTNVKGVSVLYPLNVTDNTTATTPVITVKEKVQTRAWSNKSYFLPIKFDELNRNPQLIQNPLY